MARGVGLYLVTPLVALGLFGCRDIAFEQRDPWRAEAEERCIGEKRVEPSAYVEPEAAIDGNGACGMTHPFKVSAMSGGYVAVEPKATLDCPMIGEVDRWLTEVVQPAAAAWFGEQVVAIKQFSAYSCRTVNNQPGGNISEHAFGNALDVAMFKLASGREVTVEHGWKGAYEERGFLRQVHAAACERFSTVLGPGADVFHYNHFHLDLARRTLGHVVCKPAAEQLPPPIRRQGVPVARQMLPQSPPMMAGRMPPRQDDLSLSANAQPMQRAPAPMMQRDARPVGEPLNLTPQPAPGAVYAPSRPAAIERQPYPAQPYPAYAPPSPNRPVPPASVPQAKLGSDALTTGSVDKRHYFKETPILKSQLPDATPGKD
jgi:hypothetical protein